MKYFFTKEDTVATKGFAIFLLLFHHLFYENPEFSVNVMGVNIFNKLALASKVTVAIFIILSGYGLAESVKNKKLEILNFYIKRFSKLFVTYWVIFLIFVPIGVFIFGRSIQSVYGNHAIVKLIIEFFGLQEYVFGHGYNPTWWFMSAIIALYAVFPFLYYLIKRFPVIIFIALTLLLFTSFPEHEWYLPFGVGILLSVHLTSELKTKITQFLFNKTLRQRSVLPCASPFNQKLF
ncbi:MAG: acyltransferase [Desulfosporosinus sp.]|nr:acyltransferase [Desulfosporosinus sp.]